VNQKSSKHGMSFYKTKMFLINLSVSIPREKKSWAQVKSISLDLS